MSLCELISTEDGLCVSISYLYFLSFFDAFFSHSIIKRAIEAERLSMGVTNPRDFSHNKHGQVDDTPYGGGAGMLMDGTSPSLKR